MARIDSIINDSNVDRFDRLLGSSSEGGTRNYKIQDILSLIGISDVDDLQDTLTQKADLVNGLVASSQLPSFVDEVVEADDFASLPETGALGRIYITIDNNKTYRWSGSTYIEVKDDHAVWGSIDGILSNQTDLQNALNAKGNLTGGNTWNGTQTFSSNILLQSIGATTQPFEIYFDGALNFKHNSNIVALLGTTGDFMLRNSAGFNARFLVNSVTTQRDFTLPDASGTFALVDVDNNFSVAQNFNNAITVYGAINLKSPADSSCVATIRYVTSGNNDRTFDLPTTSDGFLTIREIDNNFTASQTISGLSGQGGGIGIKLTNTTPTTGKTYEVLSYDIGEFAVRSTDGGVGQILRYNETTGWNFTTAGISGSEDALFGGILSVQGGNAQIDLYDRTSTGDNVRYEFSGGQYRFRMLDDSASTNVIVSTVDLSNYFTTFNYNVTVDGSISATNGTDTTKVLYYGITFDRFSNYIRPTTNSSSELYIGGSTKGQTDYTNVKVYTDGINDFKWNDEIVATQDWVTTQSTLQGVTDNGATTTNTIEITRTSGNIGLVLKTTDSAGGNNSPFIKWENTTTSLYARMESTGDLKILNNAFASNILTLTQSGDLDVSGQIKGTDLEINLVGTDTAIIYGENDAQFRVRGTNDHWSGIGFKGSTGTEGYLYYNSINQYFQFSEEVRATNGLDVTGTLDVSGVATFDSQVNALSNLRLPDNSYLQIGGTSGSADLMLWHNATNSYVVNFTGHYYIENRAENQNLYLYTTETGGDKHHGIIISPNSGQVNLYHDNNLKLSTTANGINLASLPTSSTGLSAGDLWNDSGTVKIV